MTDIKYWQNLHEKHRTRLSAVGYAGLGEGFNRESYRLLRLPAVQRLITRHQLKPRSLLEAGVGVGAYASLWHELGVVDWVGLDISSVAVEDLQKRFPHGEFHVTDITRPGTALEGKAFDVVVAIDVLYHIVEDDLFERALRWLASRTRNGGCFICSDVFTDSPWGGRFSHVKRRPLSVYERVLGPLGLRLVDREPVFAILGDPVPAGHWRRGWGLFSIWRVLQKSIRLMPERLKDIYGAAVVNAFLPVDTILRYSGVTRGINLELAFFVSAPASDVAHRW